MSLVQVERRGSVALLRLDDPKRRNTVSPAMCADISKAVKAAEADQEVKALVGESPFQGLVARLETDLSRR